MEKKMVIDMELENTVFLIAPVQFSVGKNCNVIYPILKYSTKYFIFCHVHVFSSTDFAGFRKILLIVRSCAIFGRFHKIAKFQKAWQKEKFHTEAQSWTHPL